MSGGATDLASRQAHGDARSSLAAATTAADGQQTQLAIALIGYGTIAKCVLRTLGASSPMHRVVGVLVRKGHAGQAAGCPVPVFESLPELLACRPEVVAETAAQSAAIEHGVAVLAGGCDLLITSSGSLSDEGFLARISDVAAVHGRRVWLPSGAIGGIDAIAAMRLAGLSQVTYCSRKPPAAWRGSAAEQFVDLEGLRAPRTFFCGTAREAARLFPKNANVAATVALAGLGMDRTTVELVADPTVTRNIHEVEADGASGRVSFRLEGAPFPDNPRSSMLTAYSVARTLLNMRSALPI